MAEITKKGQEGERIAKVIARSGYCSRREAERLIEEGVVKVNGTIVDTPAIKITDEIIKINNKVLNPQEPTRIWMCYKPKGCLTSHSDPEGRPTIFSLLPKNMPRVISIGRLDMNTEGLLLLTNDGEIAKYISSPSTGWIRKYRVRVHGKIREGMFNQLGRRGVTIEDVKYAPIKVKVEDTSAGGANNWLEISVTEGKNREVRKVMEYYGLTVNRLIRTNFGPFKLGKMRTGEVIEVPHKTLKDYLGNKIQ